MEETIVNETNNTTTRPNERTTKQKLSIRMLEKTDSAGAKMWWKRFVQYIRMTKDLDLTTMITEREILEQYREQLEENIKDLFIWAIGQNAMSEMTKTTREREPANLPLHQLYRLFRLHFTPEKNKYHSRADFFGKKREKGETAADV